MASLSSSDNTRSNSVSPDFDPSTAATPPPGGEVWIKLTSPGDESRTAAVQRPPNGGAGLHAIERTLSDNSLDLTENRSDSSTTVGRGARRVPEDQQRDHQLDANTGTNVAFESPLTPIENREEQHLLQTQLSQA